MAVNEEVMSFDDVLLAGHEVVAALGRLAAKYESLMGQSPLDPVECVGLDGVAMVIHKRAGQVPLLAVIRAEQVGSSHQASEIPEPVQRANGVSPNLGPLLALRRQLSANGSQPAEVLVPPSGVATEETVVVPVAGRDTPPAEPDGAGRASDPAEPVPPAGSGTELIPPPRPNGRSIARISEEALGRLNRSRRPLLAQDRSTKIIITGDKTYEVNKREIELRVPVDGSPSRVMQLFNIVLTGECEGKSEFTVSEVEKMIDDPTLAKGTLWQAAESLLKKGFLERRTKGGGETVFGLPKFVEIADCREAIDDTSTEAQAANPRGVGEAAKSDVAEEPVEGPKRFLART